MKKTWTLSGLMLLTLTVASLANAGQKIPVQSEKIVKTAKDYLQATINWPADQLVIESSSRIQDILVPQGKISFSVNQQNVTALGAHYTVPVRVRVNHQPVKTVYTQFTVEKYQDVVIATHPLKRHHRIVLEDITLERKNISKIKNKNLIYSDINDLLGMRTATFVQADKIIKSTAIEQVPLVLKNKQVKVIARLGNVQASLYGIAREEGKKTDVIKVENPSTKKIFMARVINKNQVELIY